MRYLRVTHTRRSIHTFDCYTFVLLAVILGASLSLAGSPARSQDSNAVDSEIARQALVLERLLGMQVAVQRQWHAVSQAIVAGLRGEAVDGLDSIRDAALDLPHRLSAMEQDIRDNGEVTGVRKLQINNVFSSFLKTRDATLATLEDLEAGNPAGAADTFVTTAVPLYENMLNTLEALHAGLAEDLAN